MSGGAACLFASVELEVLQQVAEVSIRVISPGQMCRWRRELKCRIVTFRGKNLEMEAVEGVWERCGKKLSRG